MSPTGWRAPGAVSVSSGGTTRGPRTSGTGSAGAGGSPDRASSPSRGRTPGTVNGVAPRTRATATRVPSPASRPSRSRPRTTRSPRGGTASPPVRTLLVGWTARGAGLALGVGLVWLVAMLLASSFEVLALAFIAVLLAAGLEPFVGWVRSRLPVPRAPVILLVYLAFFALVVAFAVLVLPAAAAEAEDVVRRLPSFLDEVELWAATLQPQALERTVLALVAAARDVLRLDAPEPEEVVQAGLTLAEALTAIAAVLTLVFFWLIGHARLQRDALAFVPIDRRSGVRLAWNEVEGRMGRWVRGQLVLMMVVGVLCGAAYFVLGVPSALLLGLIAGLCEAIPMVGPVLGAIPAVLFAATVSPELVLGVLAVTLPIP